MSEQSRKIAILGTGAWGTALAIHLAKIGHAVQLWGRNASHVEDMQRTRFNAKYLPRHELPESIHVTNDVREALADSQEIVCMMSSESV